MLESFTYPRLGNLPVSKLTAPELLSALRRIEVRGTNETAHRAKQRCGQILRYAIATGRAEQDVSAFLRGALAPVASSHHAAITEPGQVGQLLQAIRGYSGDAVTGYALKLSPLLFVRPGEEGVDDLDKSTSLAGNATASLNLIVSQVARPPRSDCLSHAEQVRMGNRGSRRQLPKVNTHIRWQCVSHRRSGSPMQLTRREAKGHSSRIDL
jgi:hypothetical protein